MFQGELYGYPLYLIKHIASNQDVTFCFDDVMCKLWKFVNRHAPSIAKEIIPALSVMHAKGHLLDCQVRSVTFVLCIYLSVLLFYTKIPLLLPVTTCYYQLLVQ